MAQEAVASGVRTVFCTPHLLELDPEVIAHARVVVDRFRAALVEADIELELRLGFEVDLAVAAANAPHELKELVVEGTAGALVLEMPYHGWPGFLEQALFRLSAQGLRPVLAHPERNDRVQADSAVLWSCVNSGAVIQATAASLSGEFGKAPERTLSRMLSVGLVALLASDAHAYRSDGWTLASALERLQGRVSDQGLAALVDGNPRRLISGQDMLKVWPTGRFSSRLGWRKR